MQCYKCKILISSQSALFPAMKLEKAEELLFLKRNKTTDSFNELMFTWKNEVTIRVTREKWYCSLWKKMLGAASECEAR